MREQIVAVAIVDGHIEGPDQTSTADLLREKVGIDQRNALPAQGVLCGEQSRVEDESAIDVERSEPGMPHELRPCLVPRQLVDAHVYELIRLDEGGETLAGVLRRDLRVAEDAEPDRPEKIRHQIAHHGSGVDHGDIDITERRTRRGGADEIDIDFRARLTKVAQNGYR